MTPKPVVCRPRAFELFLEQISRLDSPDALWRAASAIAMHALPDVSLDEVDRRFDALAERVRAGARSGRPVALLAHLHAVLFEQEQFAGNLEDYHSALNSYLPSVLETHRGLPILVALVYKVVGNRVGLRIDGINSPGHFLARVNADGHWMIVDPFFHGQALTRDEALSRLSDLSGRHYFGHDECLQPATHRQWLSRILTNLQNTFASEGRQRDLEAMGELQKLLWDSA